MTADGPLILVPTRFEIDHLVPRLPSNCQIRAVGFGLVESAIQTHRWLTQTGARRAVHIGIAGSLNCQSAPVGSAFPIGSVSLDGIGVGSGRDFQSAEQMGWAESGGQPIELSIPGAGKIPHRSLVSVTAASRDRADADERRSRFPQCDGEEMETFAVARACQVAGVTLSVIRGFSNLAGDRDHRRWKVAEALAAAADCYLELEPLG